MRNGDRRITEHKMGSLISGLGTYNRRVGGAKRPKRGGGWRESGKVQIGRIDYRLKAIKINYIVKSLRSAAKV
jgi:hypothetical protein